MSADRSRDVAKGIYFGAYSFGETEEGYLQAFQYSEAVEISFDYSFCG